MRRSSTKFLFILALLLFTSAAAIARHRLAFAPGPAGMDVAVDRWMKSHRLPALTAAARVLSQAGAVWAIVVVGLAVAFASRRLFSPAFSVVTLIAIASSIVLCPQMKAQFACGRPGPAGFLTVARGFGFPSQHALIGTVAWGFALTTIFRTRIRRSLKFASAAIGTLLVVALAASRVYLAVHWLTDVLLGVSLALGWLLVAVGYALLIDRARHLTHPATRPDA